MRKLVSGAAYPTDYRGPTVRVVQISTDVQTHYLGEREVFWNGNSYKPWLVVDQAIQRFRSLQVDAATVKLQNADGQLEALIFAEKFEGASVRVLDILTALNPVDAMELIRGVMTDRSSNQQSSEWQIVPIWDPGTVESPRRVYSRTCTFRFKGAECGYVDGVDPDDPGTGLPFVVCPKDFAACQARGRAHRYPGFIHITRELQQVFPPRIATEDSTGHEDNPWARRFFEVI